MCHSSSAEIMFMQQTPQLRVQINVLRINGLRTPDAATHQKACHHKNHSHKGGSSDSEKSHPIEVRSIGFPQIFLLSIDRKVQTDIFGHRFPPLYKITYHFPIIGKHKPGNVRIQPLYIRNGMNIFSKRRNCARST